MPINMKDTEKRDASVLEDTEEPGGTKDETNGEDLEHAIKRGMNTPHIKIMTKLLLGVLLTISIAAFGAGLVRYGELQREKSALENKVDEYEAEVEKLEYLIDCPVDYDYIVRVAKEKLNLYLPDEIIYHSSANGK